MTLQSMREVAVTRQKLDKLEALYAATAAEGTDDNYARTLTLRSLRRTMNQLKEDIARFEAQAGSATTDG